MATNFLNAAIVQADFSLMTTELNTLGGGSAATSSVGGSSGLFDPQVDWSKAPWAVIQFKSGGAFTPVAGQQLYGWFLQEIDGSNLETLISTPSTTVAALGRAPDFIIPLYEGGAAWANGNRRLMQGPAVRVPWAKHKIVVQNFGPSAVALPASGNTIEAIGGAIQY